MMETLKKWWKDVEDSRIGTEKYFHLAPAHYCTFQDLTPYIKHYVKGITLDLGAGRSPYTFLIAPHTSRYFTCDILPEKNLNFIADGGKLCLKSESVDTVVNIAVLEHTKNPKGILMEISRALKKNGCAVFVVPHLCYIHAEPEDYFRYTIYGFSSLLPTELKMETYKESGGLVSFTCIPFFIILHAAVSKIPVVRNVVLVCAALASKIIYKMESVAGFKKVYPLNYIAVVRKV